jgi:hypothetical protein
VSRPAKILVAALVLATIAIAVLLYRSVAGDVGNGSYWAPFVAFWILVYGAVAVTVVLVGDSAVQWFIRKRHERFANRSAKPS